MRLLPYAVFTLDLNDAPEVLAARFAARTTPDTWWSKFTAGSTFGGLVGDFVFTGEVSETGFQLRRIISYGNPYRPRLCGLFLLNNEGTRIEVSMRFPETRGAYAILTLIFVFGIIGIVAVFSSGLRSWPFALIPWIGLLFYWALIQASFWLDAPTSRRELTRILSEARN
jgi:hypothetical protein